MTPEAQRIAIAEACGWKPHGKFGIYWSEKLQKSLIARGSEVHKIRTARRLESEKSLLPNYTEDLNACAEMEKVLSDKNDGECRKYAALLNYDGKRSEFGIANADAMTRCEAFLKVKGLWQDSPISAQPKGEI